MSTQILIPDNIQSFCSAAQSALTLCENISYRKIAEMQITNADVMDKEIGLSDCNHSL